MNEQVLRPPQPPLHNVGMRRKSRALPERALEVANASPCNLGELAQFDLLIECVLDVRKNQLEPAA